MTSTSKPWWQTDEYGIDTPVPAWIGEHAGPEGVALVKAWEDGGTQIGWGELGPKKKVGKGREPGFIPRYYAREFSERKALYGYDRGRWNFAFVMRSLRLVCIDIDGKNGGLEHAKRLGMLPYTAAETSKSGDGFHLFYVVDEKWDSKLGYASLADRIGIEQGVDIRAVGCVYHHPQQRWNDRDPVALPEHLLQKLLHREQKQQAQSVRIAKILDSNDDLEVMMMHAELLGDLAKPIPQGKRNNTLFAIGQQMREAQVPDWEQALEARATDVGLDQDEVDKLIANINRYAVSP